MNYTASVSDFFKSPKWMMNLLLGGVCVLIPIVGPIVVLGWLITGFWARQDQSFETFPAFDFSHFGKYLERGLWPFLVSLVVGLLMVPVMWMVMIPAMFVGGISAGHNRDAGCLGAFAFILMMLFIFLAVFGMMLLMTPLKLRASLMQDFGKAFDLGFVKRFVTLTWKEIVLSTLFVMVISILFACLGLIVFCVGVYFATVLTYFSLMHLHKQLYLLYLSRGGEPVPLSPKLNDAPPAMPGA
jgi:hypothetical protein